MKEQAELQSHFFLWKLYKNAVDLFLLSLHCKNTFFSSHRHISQIETLYVVWKPQDTHINVCLDRFNLMVVPKVQTFQWTSGAPISKILERLRVKDCQYHMCVCVGVVSRSLRPSEQQKWKYYKDVTAGGCTNANP